MKNRSVQLLEFYTKFRGARPTVAQAFARQPTLYWVVQIFSLAIVFALYYFTKDIFVFTLLGVFVGGLARDVGWMLRFRRDWPTLDRVLDWQRVEQELAKKPSADS
jgi:hypothetical protein